MASVKQKIKTIPRFFFFLLLSLFIFFLDGKGKLDFVKRPIEQITNPLKLFVFQQKTVPSNGSEATQSLQRELAELKIKNQNLKEENQACLRLLQAPLSPSLRFLPAKVLAFNGDQFLIDKGKDQKIKEGQVVVLENVFLGQITQVQPRTSWVKTPFALEVNARTFKTKAPGKVKERGGRLFLTQVLQKETLEKEDLVLTFGEESLPRDLVIGKIKEVKKQEAEIYQEAELELVVEYGSLETVFVVL